MKKLLKNPLAVISLVLLVIILLTIVFAPMIVPYGYSQIISVEGRRDQCAKNLEPFAWSEAEQAYLDKGGELFPHIFGQIHVQRLLIRCITSKVFAVYSLICQPYGVIIGMIWAHFRLLGGKTD
jgi:oligopeptide transport system permease protein